MARRVTVTTNDGTMHTHGIDGLPGPAMIVDDVIPAPDALPPQEDITILGEPEQVEEIQEVVRTPGGWVPIEARSRNLSEEPAPVPQGMDGALEPATLNGQEVTCAPGALWLESGQLVDVFHGYAGRSPSGQRALMCPIDEGHVIFHCREDALKFQELVARIQMRVARGRYVYFCRHTDGVTWRQDGISLLVYDEAKDTLYLEVEGQTRAQDQAIGLRSPVLQQDEELYDVVSRFLTGCTKGVRRQLEVCQRNLETIASRRSEELFTYAEELPVPPGREDIHRFFMERITVEYEEDQRDLTTQRRMAEAHQRIIDSAREQLPSGKKGKALRRRMLESQALVDLLDSMRVVRNGSNPYVIFNFRQPLVVVHPDAPTQEGISYGRVGVKLELTTNPSNGREGSYIYRLTGWSNELDLFVHPHLNGTDRWCLGTYVRPIQNAFLGANWPLLAALLWEYLNRFNPGSPLIQYPTCQREMLGARPRPVIVRRR